MSSRRSVPAVLLHVGVGLVDLAFAAGEGALRAAGLFFGMLLGDKALGAALDGIVRFLLFGNLWWPALHALAAGALIAGRPTWRWGFGLALVAGRLGFVWIHGRPWFDIGDARWPASLAVVYTVVLLVLGAAQLLARPRSQ